MKSWQHTLISSAPWVPSRSSTSHRRRSMRSRATGGSLASAGNARNMRQFTIFRQVIIGSSAGGHERVAWPLSGGERCTRGCGDWGETRGARPEIQTLS